MGELAEQSEESFTHEYVVKHQILVKFKLTHSKRTKRASYISDNPPIDAGS
jgi:hypothetical protein